MNITNRITHDVQQGTGPWLRLREGFDTASEAPAALGVGRYTTRAELLRRKFTGISEDHSPATLGKFAAGHEAEARARPLAEANVGGELFPTTMTCEVDGVPLLASLDGQTLEGDVIWETKLWNEGLAEQVRAGTLDPHYTVQMDQELLVSGAERCLFTCTDGTPERYVACWYEADPEKFAALLAGWRQFRADLAAYQLPEASAEPARAEPMESLPSVSVRLDGALSVVGNLPTFAEALRAFIARMPTKPASDTEFATCDAACKALKKAEEALDAAESGALASITDVESMRRMVADCRKLARDTRLAAEKMVERRKVEIKEQAVLSARKALDAHVAGLNAEIAPMCLQPVLVDLPGAIKGLRSFDSMQNALDTVLAGAKITADAQAKVIRANVAEFKDKAAGLEFLFADLGQIVHKAVEDFALLVRARVDAHKRAEADRLEAERQRIRAEEEAKSQRKAAEELAAAQAESARLEALAEANRRRQQEAEQATQRAIEQAKITPTQDSQQVLKAEPETADATARETPATTSPVGGPMGVGQAAAEGSSSPTGRGEDVTTAAGASPVSPFADLLAHLHAGINNDRFPSHPKPHKGWWDELKVLMAAAEAAQ